MAKILIVDDERGILESFGIYLGRKGFVTLMAEDYNEAMVKLEECNFDIDVILTDQVMPGRSGLDLIKAVKERSDSIQLIMVTGEPTIDTAAESVRLGIFDYLTKPLDLDRLLSVVSAAFKLKQSEDKARELEKLASERSLALAESEDRLKEAQGLAHIGSWEWSLETNLITWSDEMFEIYGAPKGRVLSVDAVRSLIHPEDRNIYDHALSTLSTQDVPPSIEYRIIRPDGKERDVHSIAKSFRDESGRVIRLVGTLHDITERKQAENDRLKYIDQLHSLTSRLILAEENERKRVASLLHDGLGQDLATIELKLKMMGETMVGGEAGSELDDILDIVEKAIEESRDLTFDISPPILFQKSLGEALRWQFDRECRKMMIEGNFVDGTADKAVDEPLRILLFRIYRELLFNVSKHSGADVLKGSIDSDNGRLCLALEDNGKGFIPTDAQTQNHNDTGYGLFSIEERVLQLNGEMNIHSKPGDGTRIEISVPLNKNG